MSTALLFAEMLANDSSGSRTRPVTLDVEGIVVQNATEIGYIGRIYGLLWSEVVLVWSRGAETMLLVCMCLQNCSLGYLYSISNE